MRFRFMWMICLALVSACQGEHIRHSTQGHIVEGRSLPGSLVPLVELGPFSGPIPSIDRREDLTRHFAELVFFSEAGPLDLYIQKWSQNVYYKIESNLALDQRLSDLTERLQNITGISFQKVRSDDDRVNVAFLSLPGTGLEDHCHGQMFFSEADDSIIAVNIFIGRRIPETELPECLEEETSQLLGPINDVTTIEDTLWRPLDKKTYHSLTWSDAVILRALYDERIKPGMHRDKALPLVRVIIGEILDELNR